MRLAVAVVIALWSQAALAQKTLTTEEYLASLDHAADSCVYFAALNMLLDYKPTTARQVLEKVCKAQLDKLDHESCKLEHEGKEREACVRNRIPSSTTVTAAVNLMRMVKGAVK